jgi:hypothetical protein
LPCRPARRRRRGSAHHPGVGLDTKEFYDELTVTYARVPGLGLCLPATLTGRVIDEPAGQRVQATATFTSWRAVPRKKD